jgi:hypothetical protein
MLLLCRCKAKDKDKGIRENKVRDKFLVKVNSLVKFLDNFLVKAKVTVNFKVTVKDKVKWLGMEMDMETEIKLWFLRPEIQRLFLPQLLLLLPEIQGRANGVTPILGTMGQAGETTMRRIIHKHVDRMRMWIFSYDTRVFLRVASRREGLRARGGSGSIPG